MNIVVFGATSAIAQAVNRQLIEAYSEQVNFVLVGRSIEKLEIVAADLTSRGAINATCISADLSDHRAINAIVEDIVQQQGKIDIGIIAHGTLPDQSSIRSSWSGILNAHSVNALSPMAIMTALGETMAVNGQGTIVVISSVAGDRGRGSNYVYGAAKGTVSLYAQGLRNDLNSKGVHLLTVKPGFVDTPMTAGVQKSGPLWATPEKVGKDIVRGIVKQKNIIYTPFFWFFIMQVIKLIPESIFKKLKL